MHVDFSVAASKIAVRSMVKGVLPTSQYHNRSNRPLECLSDVYVGSKAMTFRIIAPSRQRAATSFHFILLFSQNFSSSQRKDLQLLAAQVFDNEV